VIGMGLLLMFDEVQTGIGRTGELFAYQRAGGRARHHVDRQAIGGGFPLGACLATAEAAKGMTAGTHGSTSAAIRWRWRPATPCSTSLLAPGFLDRVRRTALLFKQRLAELKDRHPAVIAEVRGEGLLIGLRALVPAGELVDALRAENLLTVAAGENVVRTPAAAHHRRGRGGGCDRADRPGRDPPRRGHRREAEGQGGGGMTGVRHFPSISPRSRRRNCAG